MIKFNISKSLSDALSQHFEPTKQRTPSIIWDTELVSINNELCVIAQERFSGYVMLFCQLQERDFLHFPSLFQERFKSEVSVLCPDIGMHDREEFCQHLMRVTDEQSYKIETSSFDNGPMLRVIKALKQSVERDGNRMPIGGRAAFEYTIRFNCNEESDTEDEVDKSCALELFRDLCKIFVKEFKQKKRLKKLACYSVIGTHQNVISVNFGSRSLAQTSHSG